MVRIERADDPDAISEKWADYSSGTVSRLFEQGQNDARAHLIEEELRAIEQLELPKDAEETIVANLKSIVKILRDNNSNSPTQNHRRDIFDRFGICVNTIENMENNKQLKEMQPEILWNSSDFIRMILAE